MTSTTADARFWDRAAHKYARDPIKDMAGYERTIERTRQYLKDADLVLELGCGTGTTALKLAPHVSRLIGTDVSAGMIAIAREKAVQANGTNVQFAVAPLHDMPQADGTFDVVLAFNVLHLVARRPDAFAGISRHLKPGGLFISKTPCLSEMNPLIRMAVPVMRAIGKAPYVEAFSAVELEGEMVGAGFTIVERARHGSGRKDPRIFIVARNS
jgi:ubiquinone/menaquinone biosynthesis C-methylase UbiE